MADSSTIISPSQDGQAATGSGISGSGVSRAELALIEAVMPLTVEEIDILKASSVVGVWKRKQIKRFVREQNF
jgi:hypothetical protein